MADRSELKAVDEAFAYNSGVTFLTVHMVETLLDMNSELANIDELLVDAGVEGIYHTNQEENICYSAEMLGELLAYSSDLAFYALELIDKPLYKNFNLNATESISRIKVEDYSTENTLGITYTAHTSHGDYENCAKKTLSIEDFLGVTAPENGGTLSNIPKEFTDFSNQYVTMYENMKADLVDADGNQITLEEYLDQLVSMGEFSHTKDQPFRQFLSAVLDITIILPLIEACTGTDYITDEDLSDFERGMKGVGAVVGAFSLGTSYVAMKGAGLATQEILMNMGKAVAIDAASTTTSYWTGYACNEMGLPLPLTLMLSMGAGMGTSYGLNNLLIKDAVAFNGAEMDFNDNKLRVHDELPDFDNMTELERSKFWENHFKETYGGNAVEHVSGKMIESPYYNDIQIKNAYTDVVSPDITIKGGSYDKLPDILEKYNITEKEYYYMTRTPQHKMPAAEREIAYKIRMELTADVTDGAGVVKPGTKVCKAIDEETFKAFYGEGQKATLGGCIALERDVSCLDNATEIVDSTGLRFEGSNFVDNSGNTNVFYMVEGELKNGQPDVVVRVSATTDAVELNDAVVKQFTEAHPDYEYNGFKIDDNSSANNTYLNEIWSRNSEKQVEYLSKITGVDEQNIVTEEARFYNRISNPDMGAGITLDQGSSTAIGRPEFYAIGGRPEVKNGCIYKIDGNEKILVGTIDRRGIIALNGGR
ncbi:pre-toxin TG domain-containing protein [Pseudobutyrivibrio sp.]